MRRFTFAVIAVLVAGVTGWDARPLRGAAPTGEGVTVGSQRVAPEAIEAAAARIAGHRSRRLPAARRAAADRAIERLWLEGEARARGLRGGRALTELRGQVADALAGPAPVRDARGFAKAFDAFHERWRSRTRCELTYHDPYEDRCGDRGAAAAGSCRWLGEATLCSLRGDRRTRWLVTRDAGAKVVRVRSRAAAVALALAAYAPARAARERTSRRVLRADAAAAAERAAAADLQARERERELRRRDPRLSAPALVAARAACRRQVADSDPYMFAFGLQDVLGGAEGLFAARSELARRLAGSARDSFDRRKLRPLVRAIGAGNRALARLAAAEAAGDDEAVAGIVARLDARTEPERALARALGLGDCLVRPARR